MNYCFSQWVKWRSRSSNLDLEHPGVYMIAVSHDQLRGNNFELIEEIIYIGRTFHSLKTRLGMFDRSARSGEKGHSGGRSFHREYAQDPLHDHTYVSICPFRIDDSSSESEKLRNRGLIAKAEWDCIAAYVEKFSRRPKLNTQ